METVATVLDGGPVQQPLFELEELTVKHSESIIETRAKVKTMRQMVKDVYAAHETFIKQKEKVTEEKKLLQQVKETIDQVPEMQALKTRLKECQEELKEQEVSISDYAVEYARMSGKNSIERGGVTYDIVQSAKIVRRLK